MIDWDFNQSAKALVKALNETRDVTNGGTSPLCELTSWVIETKNDPVGGHDCDEIYLSHPPVFFRSNHYNSHRTGEEDEIIDDGDVEFDEISANNLVTTGVTEWSFSVLFHSVYRVPTLYFQVHDIDGTPTTREEVVKMLCLRFTNIRGNSDAINTHNSMTEEQTWDFVSQEEHPMTGIPSFFLHPCRTAAKMELLLLQPQDLCPLLSWMSMILPSVGCTISPFVYHEAQKKISYTNIS